jgi:DNA-binding LacI/PurR family transcriptional regulator
MRRLLAGGDGLPTGLFVHNDSMALGALAVLHEAGIGVPDDLSLVGYNDLAMVGFVDPPLTTVRYPSLEVGRAAGEMVQVLLSGEIPENSCLDPTLVVRGSTRRL